MGMAGDQSYSTTTSGDTASYSTASSSDVSTQTTTQNPGPVLLDQPPGIAPSPGVPSPVSPASALTPPVVPRATTLDTANGTKFYTITASLREEYDDNIYTARHDKTGSFVTEFSPSILASFPMQDSTFSGRYTFGLDYYENRRGNQIDYTHEALFRYQHNFSNRFNLDLRDQVGYYEEPDILNSIGTVFRDGAYYTNTFTGVFNAQWTPVFATSTSYSNISIFYTDSAIATAQNSDENTLAQDFRFALQPKVNLVVGGIFDDIDYFEISRGYTDYTGNVGLDYQALPNLSVGFRVGGTLTTSDSAGDSASPYAAVTLNWQIGKRSSLAFGYVHDVVPTDVFNAIGQEANRFNLRFSYDVTPRITVHLEGIETYSDYTSSLLQPGAGPSFDENDIGVDLGGEYRLTSNISFEAGYLFSDVSSGATYRDYSRNQVYVGVRGTY
jgi:hypothetical protein